MSVTHYNVVEFTAKLAKNTASLDTLHVMCPPPPQLHIHHPRSRFFDWTKWHGRACSVIAQYQYICIRLLNKAHLKKKRNQL